MSRSGPIVLVANIPTPYREPVHERLADALPGQYHVIYSEHREPNRLWTFPYADYPRTFLRRRVVTFRQRFIHVNPDVWTVLNKLDPQIVIVAGHQPTGMIAFVWAKLHRRPVLLLTEGNLRSERDLSLMHRAVRSFMFRRSAALIGVSVHSLDMFRRYGCSDDKLFRSYYSVDNERYDAHASDLKQFDLLFSGQLIERKQPLFFAEVARLLRVRRGDCSALVLGDGPLARPMREALHLYGVRSMQPGFVQPSDLPRHYGSARVFLFPTLRDTWGVVANEAVASGIPVLTCPDAGVAHDLIVDGRNGFILPLDAVAWAERVDRLLTDPTLYASMASAARETATRFTHDGSAQGILDAICAVRQA